MSDTLPGIHVLPNGGYRVVASISRTVRQEKRFPKGTAVRTMTRWQADTRVELRKRPTPAEAGSILADIENDYMPAVATMPTRATRRRHLGLWAVALGPHRRRDTVSAHELRAILERWRAGGWEPATCNRARTALMHFYTVLNGKSGANPVRDVPKYRERVKPPKPNDYATLERILDAMPDTGQRLKGETPKEVSQTKARLRVIAYTGIPHAGVMRLTPEHVQWAERVIYLKGRDKGDGTHDALLPLTAAGIAALAAFAAADAWGPFSQSAMRTSFRRAAKACGRPDLTPYDLRHLYGTQMLRSSKNRSAVRDLMQHTTDTTTNRYVRGAIRAELLDAVAAYDRDVVVPGCGTTHRQTVGTEVK
jgi:integrase